MNSFINKIIYILIEDINDIWFSFFSGVVANIPISLLFSFQEIGLTPADHWFFGLMISEIFISILTTYIAFYLTIKQKNIRCEANQIYENWISKNQLTSESKRKEILHDKCKENMACLKRVCILAFWCILLLFIGIIAMWVVSNFIS